MFTSYNWYDVIEACLGITFWQIFEDTPVVVEGTPVRQIILLTYVLIVNTYGNVASYSYSVHKCDSCVVWNVSVGWAICISNLKCTLWAKPDRDNTCDNIPRR